MAPLHMMYMHLEGYDLLLMTTVDDNVGIECFGDIPPNNWTLLACDGKGTYCNNPAVVLTDTTDTYINYYYFTG